jgi:hypothetical protein
MKERTVLSACFTVVVLAIKICSEFVGFSKLHLAASPKTFNEIVAGWPLLLGLGVFVFAASWMWLASQEKMYVICSGCLKMTEKGNSSPSSCAECGAALEDLDGFYERHPEKASNQSTRPDR